MRESVESLLLEHLERSEATLGRIERRLDEHTSRMAQLEDGLATIAERFSRIAAGRRARQLAFGRLSTQLERIERRLELTH